MCESDGNSNFGCTGMVIVLLGVYPAFLVLGFIAQVVEMMTGVKSNTAFTWVLGLAVAAAFTWAARKIPLFGGVLLGTGTAIGMIVLLLAMNGGDTDALDASWVKWLVATVSVGIGFLPLLWKLGRTGTR